jgi:LDH2 family malate/lactate/ureidoglycolate dehydrogenase
MSGDEGRVIANPDALVAFCGALFVRAGVSPDDARETAMVFCQAERMGEESHGLRLVPRILGRLKAGGTRAGTRTTAIMDRGAVALWDAERSLGQVVAARAMRDAIDKARAHGIGLVAVRNGSSFTSAKYYALLATDAGMIGLVFTNTSRKLMPPPGGATPVLGNNPVAYAAPAGRYGAMVLDMAATAAAVERIVQARDLGEAIPAGWALDAAGNPTTDPAAALASLSLLPFGGYKAFGLALFHEVLTSVLAGGALRAGDATGFEPYDRPMNTSFTMQAIDIAAFRPLRDFEQSMEQLIDAIKASRPIPGSGPILYPGERAFAAYARSEKSRVAIAARTLTELNRWAANLGCEPLPVLRREPDLTKDVT